MASKQEYSKKYYEENKEKIKDSSDKARKRFKQKWAEFKSALSCTQCGEKHPATLDFHHVVRDKSNRKVFDLVRNYNWNSLMDEIDKCIVLCANCHRKHHADERVAAKKAKKKKAT